MAEYLTVYEKAMRYDRLHAYFTDPMGADVRCEECEAANQFKVIDAISHDQARLRKFEAENVKLRNLCSRMALNYLPNDIRMTAEEWDKRDEQIADELQELGIEVQA